MWGARLTSADGVDQFVQHGLCEGFDIFDEGVAGVYAVLDDIWIASQVAGQALGWMSAVVCKVDVCVARAVFLVVDFVAW
jgi:hypothetical protein